MSQVCFADEVVYENNESSYYIGVHEGTTYPYFNNVMGKW